MQANVESDVMELMYDLLDSCEETDELELLRQMLTPIPEAGTCYVVDVSTMIDGVFVQRSIPAEELSTGWAEHSWCFSANTEFMDKYGNTEGFFSSYQYKLSEQDAVKFNSIREILSL